MVPVPSDTTPKTTMHDGSLQPDGLAEGTTVAMESKVAMAFEGSNESLDAGDLMFEALKNSSHGDRRDESDVEDSWENLQDSWGAGAVVCELPSELAQPKCFIPPESSPTNTKKKKISGLFRARRRASFGGMDSSNHSSASNRSTSSYMGPRPLGKDGKPLKSCMSATNSVTGDLDDSDNSQSTPVKSKMKRSVSFDQVQFREYERALGDNPSVTSGPPLTIGWRYNETATLPVEKYEDLKPKPRTKSELQVPRGLREQMLREQADVTSSQLAKANREVTSIQHQRKMTSATLHHQVVHEAAEKIGRKLKRIIKRTSKEKEEDELWENAALVASQSADGL